MSYPQTRLAQRNPAVPDGSRTIVIHDSQPREEPEDEDVGHLDLQGGPRSPPRVAWTEDVIDNEGMGKKKSKICCIYRKQRPFDESSSEEDSDGSDSDSDSYDSDCEGHGHNHSHSRKGRNGGGGGPGGGSGKKPSGGNQPNGKASRKIPPNAYERQPGTGKPKPTGAAS